MKEIPLTGSDIVVLVDDEDYEELAKYKWKNAKGYGVRSHSIGYIGKKHIVSTVSMHRVIMKARKDQVVDHINRNRADNRKENLRFATYSENQANRIDNKSKSGIRGIHTEGKMFVARISKSKKRQEYRTSSLEDAKRWYNEKGKELYGEFAVFLE